MARTNIFVSYSHQDDDWLRKFKQHIAVLERGGLVELWSDLDLAIGTPWEREIEAALTRSKAAVLLISPAFLASEYIWTKEMPRIVAHSDQGMEALPLIIRPCAWKLEPFLSQLLARPREPLSLGSISQIDSDLSDFTYELAAKIGKWSPPEGAPLDSRLKESPQKHANIAGVWTGTYNDTLAFSLVIRQSGLESFDGKIEYTGSGTITTVRGAIHQNWPRRDPIWVDVAAKSSKAHRLALTFKEVGYEKKGNRSVDLAGEYRALATETEMVGAWFNARGLVGRFTARRAIGE